MYCRSAQEPNLRCVRLDEMAMMTELTWKVCLGRIRIDETMAGGSPREDYHRASEFVEDLEVGYSAEFARQEIDGEFISFEERVHPGSTGR